MARFTHCQTLQALLEHLQLRHGGFRLLRCWSQGELHHDLVLRLAHPGGLPGSILVVAVHSTGSVKEMICFASPPERNALWQHRCRNLDSRRSLLPPMLARTRHAHWAEHDNLLASRMQAAHRSPHKRGQEPAGGRPSRPPGQPVRHDTTASYPAEGPDQDRKSVV